MDLRKINALISDDYINNNHPISTLSDAAQHLAGKQLFCKLDCSQAYHCLQMADRRSVELLAFNFASKTFAYRRLAQGLSRALSVFSSFMREYLDTVIKADQCAQYVDDIGIAANTTEQLIKNIRAVFKCIHKAGLKLTIEKCHFGVTQIEFLGRTITPHGVAPQDHKITNFLSKIRFPRSKKQVEKYIGFINYYRNYIPRLSEKKDWNVRTPKSRCKNHHIRRASRQFQSHQRKPSGSMWTSPQTTCCGKTICTNDGRKFPSIRLRPNDRRKRRQKTTLQTKNLRTGCFWFSRILSVLAKNVNIL